MPGDDARAEDRRLFAGARRSRWASTPAQREEWELIVEWSALPVIEVRGRDRVGGFDTRRLIRRCPEAWLETEEGRAKARRLCEILGREPFDWGEEDAAEQVGETGDAAGKRGGDE